MTVAYVGSQAGLVALVSLPSTRPADFFSPGVAVVVTVVSLLVLWLCCRSLGHEGFERVDRRLGDHRRPEQVYGPDAVPVPPALMALATVPFLLLVPVVATLGMSGAMATPMPAVPLIAGGVAAFAAGYVGRSTLVAVVVPVWLAAASSWFWAPRPVPDILGVLVAVGSLVWLAWSLRRSRRHPRARVPSRRSRRPGGHGHGSRAGDGHRRERHMADLIVEFDERRWIVLPATGDPDAPPHHRLWAHREAQARWSYADRGAAGRSSPEELAEVLTRWAKRLPGQHEADGVAEMILLHHPVGHGPPMPVYLHVWPRIEGPRDDALRGLVRADDAEAIEPPVVQDVVARHLGDGLRGLAHFELQDRADPGGPGLYAVLSYAWRVEDCDVDVRVWCSTPELGRLTVAVADIDELVDGLRMSDSDPEPAAAPAGRSSPSV